MMMNKPPASPRNSPRNSTRSRLKDGLGMEELRSWAITMLQAYGNADEGSNSSDANPTDQPASPDNKMNDLLRAARGGEGTKLGKTQWTDRVRENDPELHRLDLSHSLLKDLDATQKQDLFQALPHNRTVHIVHLSGLQLDECLTDAETVQLVQGVGQLPELEELFCFRGNNSVLDEDMLGWAVTAAQNLKVLMIWGYSTLGDHFDFAGALRSHHNLERVTITLPKNMPYACLDVYAMGFAAMPRLHCLNIRGSGKQREPVISPEAMSVLLRSASMESLYLENVGLIDDHTDAICNELRNDVNPNQALGLLDLKDNFLSDDAMFTFAQTLPYNTTLQSLDLSGVQITDRAGQALAEGLAANTTLQHLELEGTLDKYADEFDVKPGHENAEWYKALDYQLRLNRAGSTGNRKKFVEALNSVSDHLGCLYTVVRQSPQYCDLHFQQGQRLGI